MFFSNVPCTLITGFLGSGKTSLINHLLQYKNADEKWGLLINEFGQIGIDAKLMNTGNGISNNSNDSSDSNNNISDGDIADLGIGIREVNGGCICCTSQLPLQIALSRLLSEHKPSRLLIEPTGLAHPKTLIEHLSANHWQSTLRMQAVICTLNAKHWQQQKHRQHEGYQAHVKYADIVVINRWQHLNDAEKSELTSWICQHNITAKPTKPTNLGQTNNTHIYWQKENDAQVVYEQPKNENINSREADSQEIDRKLEEIDRNEIDDNTTLNNTLKNIAATWLQQPSQVMQIEQKKQQAQTRISLSIPTNLSHLSSHLSSPLTANNLNDRDETHDTNAANQAQDINELPYRYHEHQQGIDIGGWRLPDHWVFDADALQIWLLGLADWQRIKGVIHTQQGWLRINFTIDSLSSISCAAQVDSRLEIILFDTAGKKTPEDLQIHWQGWDEKLMGCLVENC